MRKKLFAKWLMALIVGTMVLTPVSVLADDDDKAPTRIDRISATEKSVRPRKAFELKVYTKEKNIDEDYFVWSSSDESVVTIWDDDDDDKDNDGDDMEFKALKSGTAIITCKIRGTNIKKTCKVTVLNKAAYIDVDDEDDFEVEVGKREKIKAKLRYANFSDKKLVYKSLTPGIISVNQKGYVYGKDVGKGKVQVYSKAHPSVSTTFEVLVEYDD